jgi:hypothetical protein
LRFGPSPRSDSVAAPAVVVDPVLISSPSCTCVNAVAAGTNCGSSFSVSSIAIALCRSRASESTVWIGLLAS